MNRCCSSLSAYIAFVVAMCLSSPVLGAEIKIHLNEVAKEWLAAEGIKDVSRDLKTFLVAAEKREKATTAASDFEKSLLDGKPLDPEKHALAVALNLLRLTDFGCLVVVADYKEKGKAAFVGSNPVVHKSGCGTTEVDLATIPGLRSLGKVECRITDITAKVDNFEVTKDKPGTARLTVSFEITVVSKASKANHRKTLVPYRITAWKDVEWRELEKWKKLDTAAGKSPK